MPASLGRRGAQVALALVVLLVLVAAGWTWLTLSWAYSVGERAILGNCFGDTPYFAESFTIIPAAPR
jgi:hypothetical protein